MPIKEGSALEIAFSKQYLLGPRACWMLVWWARLAGIAMVASSSRTATSLWAGRQRITGAFIKPSGLIVKWWTLGGCRGPLGRATCPLDLLTSLTTLLHGFL